MDQIKPLHVLLRVKRSELGLTRGQVALKLQIDELILEDLENAKWPIVLDGGPLQSMVGVTFYRAGSRCFTADGIESLEKHLGLSVQEILNYSELSYKVAQQKLHESAGLAAYLVDVQKSYGFERYRHPNIPVAQYECWVKGWDVPDASLVDFVCQGLKLDTLIFRVMYKTQKRLIRQWMATLERIGSPKSVTKKSSRKGQDLGLGKPLPDYEVYRMWGITMTKNTMDDRYSAFFVGTLREEAWQYANRVGGMIHELHVLKCPDGKFLFVGAPIDLITVADVNDVKTAIEVASDAKKRLLRDVFQAE